jgi:hypothetical protein
MDVVTLTAFLSPFLPYLLKLGEKAAEKFTETAAEKFGEAAWGKANAIWSKLGPKVNAKEAAFEAATDVAINPEDEDARIALKRQLQKLLEQDAELAHVITQLLQADAPDGVSAAQNIQKVTGKGNIVINNAIGSQVIRNIQGNVTITK